MQTPLQRADDARRARDRRSAVLKVLLAMVLSVLAYFVAPSAEPWMRASGFPGAGQAPASEAAPRPDRAIAARRQPATVGDAIDGFEPAATTSR